MSNKKESCQTGKFGRLDDDVLKKDGKCGINNLIISRKMRA